MHKTVILDNQMSLFLFLLFNLILCGLFISSSQILHLRLLLNSSLFTELVSLFSFLQTPERKVKGHFSTGHADSPATIMIGRAHTTTVKMDYGQAPKVVKNSALKLCMDINESFTGN